MPTYLEFEKPIAELEGKIEELRHLANADDMNIADEVAKLQGKADKLLRQTYGKLTAWQKTLVARHQDRPHFGDYVGALVEDWTPLAGDRNFAEDRAILGGLGRFRGRSVVVMGHEKGADTATRVHHNFGMARPEGYRKAQRLMDLADRFRLPVVTLVDTPAPIPASTPRPGARPRPSPGRSRPASGSAFPWSPRSSARAVRAGRSRSLPATGC